MDLNKHGFSIVDDKYRYSIESILSYNRFLNIIYGGRSIGKTYSAKCWASTRAERGKGRFIYIRRHDTQLINMSSFFADCTGPNAYKKEKWTVSTKKKEPYFIYDGEVAGYYSSLNDLMNKSIVFEDVANVIIDEFMVSGGYQRYMPDEFNCFLNVIDTLNRYVRNDMKVIMLSNNTSLYNPYFLEIGYTGSSVGEFWAPKLKGELPPDETAFKYHTVIQRVETNENLKAAFRNSAFGRFIQNSTYAEHAIENRSLFDTNDFISKKTGDCIPMFNFIADKNMYSVWSSTKTGYIYVCNGKSNSSVTFSANMGSDFVEGTYSIYSLKIDGKYKFLVNAYNSGRLFYENSRCKNAAFKMMRNIMRI